MSVSTTRRKDKSRKEDPVSVKGAAAEAGARSPAKPLCLVGIGASAGGLEALLAFFGALPATTGMAFVIVTHMSPEGPSQLAELVGRACSMPVRDAGPATPIERDHVYVIRPGAVLRYADGQLHSTPREPEQQHAPIDTFLRSIALGKKSRSIGVVLSGTGSDGALGVQDIKAAGGITFAQEVVSAKFDGMPLAALATGCVDFMLPPEGIAAEITGISKRLRATSITPATPADALEDDLKRILQLLRSAHEVDFIGYRRTTVRRRILRRMVLAKVDNLADYHALLAERPLEMAELYRDILINVTHFFRDPDVFGALAEHAIPALLKDRRSDDPIRVWVPGCSTGEEAYSIAILLLEALSQARQPVPFQVFATDVSEAALEVARTGAYIENITLDVSPERLRRFFTRNGRLWQVNKSIREHCIFARQNLLRDPPFSRMDLISCRNVLIYFERSLQKRVIPLFHYALKPSGFLMLGASEALGSHAELFSSVDKKHKLFSKSGAVGLRPGFEFAASRHFGYAPLDEEPGGAPRTMEGGIVSLAHEEADRLVMSRYAPPGVIVNADMQIVQFRGHTGPYLEPAPGEASLNVLKMARDGLGLELRGAIHKARSTGTTVRVEGVRVSADGVEREVTLEVTPLRGGGEDARSVLVLFEEQVRSRSQERAAGGPSSHVGHAKGADARVAKLEQQLAAAKEYLQATIEEQEATNEELQSANEELVSSNEELQSMNEELETAKEELTSSNEELTTTNEELGARNTELYRRSGDLDNLLRSADLTIVMLSGDLKVRRFTPQAERVLNIISGDLGRSIDDIKLRVDVPDLGRLLTEAAAHGTSSEREVRDREGRTYALRVRPYRTAEGTIDGTVLLLVDIDSLKAGWIEGSQTGGGQRDG